MYALVLYLLSKLQESLLAEVHAFDIADWSNTTKILLESYASLGTPSAPNTTPSDQQAADGTTRTTTTTTDVPGQVHTASEQERLKIVFTRLQSVTHFNGQCLSAPGDSAAGDGNNNINNINKNNNNRRGHDMNDAADRAGICAEVNRTRGDEAASSTLNIFCMSHLMSHCAEGDCAFMRRLQQEIGSNAKVDVFLSEEYPAFHSGKGDEHARLLCSPSAETTTPTTTPTPPTATTTSEEAGDVDHFAESIAEGWTGRRVDEGFKTCKAASNLYFYANFAHDAGIGDSCQPARKLHKAEREWEQFLHSRDAQQRLLLVDLVLSLEAWKVEHADAISPADVPGWLLKRIAFVGAHGRSVVDVLNGKQLRGPAFDILLALVSKQVSKLPLCRSK
ncbi:unnamed protein product [Polarella glacialis]|uniref:Uncharacterized protein n=1 Tax=Polarella glacialis TaxID=89957 RepID=A0A813FJA5_POLGL|nr:unnamed protein product [Polarella glacialis]